MNIELPEGAVPYLRIQRTKKRDQGRAFDASKDCQPEDDPERIGDIVREVEELQSVFDLQPDGVLDFACGLGIGAVAMRKVFPLARIYALDGNGPPDHIAGMMGESQTFWNDLELTRAVVSLNKADVTVIDKADAALLPGDIDTVVSQAACGWHWPLENDMELFERIGAKTIVIDSRRNSVLTVPGGWFIRNAVVQSEKRVRIRLDRS